MGVVRFLGSERVWGGGGLRPFSRLYWRVLGEWLVLGLINLVVWINVWGHPPLVGYDASGHVLYIWTLGNGRLPTPYDTHEFFSPPLPYALPALLRWLGWVELDTAVELAQGLNGLVSVGITVVLWRLARLLYPHDAEYRLSVVVLLGIMPVYYKTLTFIRGEPWVTLFVLLVVYELAVWLIDGRFGRGQAVRLGVWLGLAALSRQWAFLVFPALFFFLVVYGWRHREQIGSREIGRFVRYAVLVVGLILVIAGWFYAHLHLTYGSVAAFNRAPESQFSLANQSRQFYLGLGDGLLFADPVRPSFANQLIPTFYAEFWGDYEGYFLVYVWDAAKERFVPPFAWDELFGSGEIPPYVVTNRFVINRWLGWVNGVALGVTAVFLVAFVWSGVVSWYWWRGVKNDSKTAVYSLCWLVLLISAIGYLCFLILYPNPGNGDTIKATYLLHTYPLLALLTGAFWRAVRLRWHWGNRFLWGLVGGTAVFLAPAFISRYALFMWR
ncbi:MAG: hypothetical protein D6706_13980 [Chloroflexi bacterium]|nr:MAG: hypothetical protein D6706_13980 [Chloroflexota bacterium]